MTRLIDADVLMTELSELIDGENDGSEGMKMWDSGVKSAIRIVKSAPTVPILPEGKNDGRVPESERNVWIPVTERLPAEGPVLVTSGGEVRYATFKLGMFRINAGTMMYRQIHPKYWMPLQNPPTE